mgnify:CR=1 FL=1
MQLQKNLKQAKERAELMEVIAGDVDMAEKVLSEAHKAKQVEHEYFG